MTQTNAVIIPMPNKTDAIFPIELKRLWVMRILVKLNGQRRLFDNASYYLFDFIGIKEIGHTKAEITKLYKKLNDEYQRAEMHGSASIGGDLAKNIDNLANLIGLNAVERAILGFAILINNDRILSDCAETINVPNIMSITRALAEILNVDEAEIQSALHPNATLARVGVLRIAVDIPYLRGKFSFSIEELDVYKRQAVHWVLID